MSGDAHALLVEESTRRMVSGMEKLSLGEWEAAALDFRAAADLRERLLWQTDGESAWMLAAAWMNHGDALVRGCDKARLEDALTSFDRAIEAMAAVDLAPKPARPDRLILAWVNRAGTAGELGNWARSLEDFAMAETLLAEWGETATPVRVFLAAMLRINRARTLISAGRPLDAWEQAKEGTLRLQPLGSALEAIAAGIQGRSVQCRALAALLDEPNGADLVGDWIAEATDSAEQALAIVRRTGFHDHWVADLVRYGARIYRTCQPHFLGEFLAEWLGGSGPLAADATLKEEMRNVLWLTLAETERKVLEAPHETAFVEKQTRVVRALQKGIQALS